MDSKKKETTAEGLLEEQTMRELATLIAEGMKEQQQAEIDPFEIYTQVVRSSLHVNVENFSIRFSKGYRLLMKELADEKAIQKKSGHFPADHEGFNF